MAVMTVQSVYEPDKMLEAQRYLTKKQRQKFLSWSSIYLLCGFRVFGTVDDSHPGVFHLLHNSGTHYIGGALEGVQLPEHYDFCSLRSMSVEGENE